VCRLSVVLVLLVGAPPAIAQPSLEDLKARATQGDYAAQRSLAGCLSEEAGGCPIQPQPSAVEGLHLADDHRHLRAHGRH
jgi:hypothetical protein